MGLDPDLFLEPVSEDLICAICQQPLSCAISLCSEGHTFCLECASVWARSQARSLVKCPTCRRDVNPRPWPKNRIADQIIGDLRVRCQTCCSLLKGARQSTLSPCSWTGKHCDLVAHLEDCSYIECHRCGAVVVRGSFSDHVAKCEKQSTLVGLAVTVGAVSELETTEGPASAAESDTLVLARTIRVRQDNPSDDDTTRCTCIVSNTSAHCFIGAVMAFIFIVCLAFYNYNSCGDGHCGDLPQTYRTDYRKPAWERSGGCALCHLCGVNDLDCEQWCYAEADCPDGWCKYGGCDLCSHCR